MNNPSSGISVGYSAAPIAGSKRPASESTDDTANASTKRILLAAERAASLTQGPRTYDFTIGLGELAMQKGHPLRESVNQPQAISTSTSSSVPSLCNILGEQWLSSLMDSQRDRSLSYAARVDLELKRASYMAALREEFANLCTNVLGIVVPKESVNRFVRRGWMLLSFSFSISFFFISHSVGSWSVWFIATLRG